MVAICPAQSMKKGGLADETLYHCIDFGDFELLRMQHVSGAACDHGQLC
jgi:hypothetical protein